MYFKKSMYFANTTFMKSRVQEFPKILLLKLFYCQVVALQAVWISRPVFQLYQNHLEARLHSEFFIHLCGVGLKNVYYQFPNGAVDGEWGFTLRTSALLEHSKAQ